MQKLYFEMRKVCKDTLATNKNERLEGDDYFVKAFKESQEPNKARLPESLWKIPSFVQFVDVEVQIVFVTVSH